MLNTEVAAGYHADYLGEVYMDFFSWIFWIKLDPGFLGLKSMDFKDANPCIWTRD